MNQSILLPGVSHYISLADARVMTARYRDQKENILAPAYQASGILSFCETFNRAEFDFVMAQEGCVGVRIYFGMTEELKVKVIVVGVNAENEDILPSSVTASVAGEGETGIIEYGRPCPEYCPKDLL